MRNIEEAKDKDCQEIHCISTSYCEFRIGTDFFVCRYV